MVPRSLVAAPKLSPAPARSPPIPQEVPASLAGLPALDIADEPTPAPAAPPAPAPAAPVSSPPASKSDPPASGPKPDPKPTTRKIAFKEDGDGRRIGEVRVEYEGAAGPGAVKAKVIAFGKEHQVVLPKKDEQSVRFTSPEGPEVSVTLMFTGTNKEGDKEILVDISGMKTGSDKAKETATKAVSKAGTLLATLKHHIPEIVLGTFGVALSTTVLAVTDLRLWMEQHMGGLRWLAIIGVPLVMVGVAVWSSFERKKPEEKKTDDKKEA
jgi:hypothetical protein